MSEIFFTSDLHFGHKNLLKFTKPRPFTTIEEHDQTIIDNWNSVVNQDDTVYVRNDKEKVDYEILLDAREFSKIQPHSSNPKYSLQTDEDDE